MSKPAGPISTIIAGIAFCAIGYFVGFHFGKPLLDNAKASQDWPSIQGTIESSRVVRDYGTGGKKYKYAPEITFSYTVGSEKYIGSDISFGGSQSYSDSFKAERVTKRYRKGTLVDIYYNPESPGISVLEAGVSSKSYIPYVIGLSLLGIGILILLSLVFKILALFTGN